MKEQTKAPIVERRFTATMQPGSHVFDSVKWAKRDAKITDAQGKAFFEQKDVEFPETWSQSAVNIVASKYFKGPMGTSRRESSVQQLVTRVTGAIRDEGLNQGHFLDVDEARVFQDELAFLLINQMACFNSPVWFNVGVKDEESHGWCWYGRTTGNQERGTTTGPRKVRPGEHKPQTSACFIVAPEDNMESILDWVKTEGQIFKGGSGAGANVSKLRSEKEFLTSGGRPSGPLSFMRICDTAAGSIKSGGKHRRAAKMIVLNSDHPDIFEFVNSKAGEEGKIRKLIEAGFPNDFNDPQGAQAAAFYQNENHSVSADDEFMRSVERDEAYTTHAVTTGNPVDVFDARKLMREIAQATWECGDPGMQFRDTMNEWNVVRGTGDIRGSNPCSEFIFLDDTSCNLASLNLMRFIRKDGSFDIESFRHAVHIMIIAQDILVDMSSYPTEAICRNSHNLRPLGLGYANLGALLMQWGYPYDSDNARTVAAEITALMTSQAYLTSTHIAAERMGPFPLWDENAESAASVIFKHSEAAAHMKTPSPVQQAAESIWRAVYRVAISNGRGFRNAQTTVLAPTGTIGFMMDCDTTGIEPDLALVKYKTLVGGGVMKIVNQGVRKTLEGLGYEPRGIEDILKKIEETGSVEGSAIAERDVPIFDTASPAGPSNRSIHYMGHVKMMAAVQPFLSGAISKTVNMPESSTAEDIEDAYMQAWKLGLKAIAIYRDGSKNFQPMVTKKTKSPAPSGHLVDADLPFEGKLKTLMDTEQGKRWLESFGLVLKGDLTKATNIKDLYAEGLTVGMEMGKKMPTRRKLPDTRSGFCHKFDISGHQGYLHVGLYPDGKLGEIFITMNKEGSTLAGLMGNFSLAISMGLQYGVPLERYVEKFRHCKYEPAGITKHPDIHFADSIVDYIFRYLEIEFIKPKMPDDHFIQQMESTARAGEAANGILQAQVADLVAAGADVMQIHDETVVSLPTKSDSSDAPFCNECGSLMVRSGACFKCGNCGGTSGCS